MRAYPLYLLILYTSCQLKEQPDCVNDGSIIISNKIEVSFLEFADSTIVYEISKKNNYELNIKDYKILKDSILNNFNKNKNVTKSILKNMNIENTYFENYKIKRKKGTIILYKK